MCQALLPARHFVGREVPGTYEILKIIVNEINAGKE